MLRMGSVDFRYSRKESTSEDRNLCRKTFGKLSGTPVRGLKTVSAYYFALLDFEVLRGGAAVLSLTPHVAERR